jgi:hypothetical protein
MKKQIAKTITILSLLVMFSVGANNVSAFPVCTTCKPPVQYCRTCIPPVQFAVSASAQNVDQASAQDFGGRETAPAAQPEYSFSFALFMARLAMSFWF